MNQHQNTITIINNYDHQKIIFNKEIEKFSIILSDDLDTQTQFQIPSEVQILSQTLSDIKKFVEYHEYNPKLLTVQKFHLFHKPQIKQQKTLKFIQNVLKLKTDHQIRNLIHTSNYLQINTLIEIIKIFLANKFYLSYSDKQMKQKLIQQKIELSQSQILQLKLQYQSYFNLYGQRIINKIDNIP